MDREKLLAHLSDFLQVPKWKDMGVNGLQVEGKKEIRKIATGVSASVAMIMKSLEAGADTLIVHHGILWDKMDPVVRGPLRERLAGLISHRLNLIAYHLPLDGHPDVGNNAQIAEKLGLKKIADAFPYHGSPPIGCVVDGRGMKAEHLKTRLMNLFGDPVIHLDQGPSRLERIGIVSGGGQSEYATSLVEGCDAFITGEISEYNVDMASESGTHFFCCGHYRTEQFGIQALGEHISSMFDVEVKFISLPHPY